MLLTPVQPKVQALKVFILCRQVCKGKGGGEREEYNSFHKIAWEVSSDYV